MTEFYNPYHFVPVVDEASTSDLSVKDFTSGVSPTTRHDRYSVTTENGKITDGYSGRIICKLTTKTPMVIGAKQVQQEDGYTKVEPFILDGRPAIPPTSLKGMISSIAEAASNSSLRVLEDMALSYRAPMEEALSAMGMMIKSPGGSGWTLLPLALPTILKPNDRQPYSLPEKYRKMFPIDSLPPPLKVYFGDYHPRNESQGPNPDLPLRSYSKNNEEYFYTMLAPRRWGPNHTIRRDDNLDLNRGHIVAQKTTNRDRYLKADNLPKTGGDRYTRGILRVLGIEGRSIPKEKRYEIFIPYPPEAEERKLFPVENQAIERFTRMADERTKASKEPPYLPYEPVGTIRNPKPKDKNDHAFRLKHGDIVFFTPNKDGDAVEEISLSSIWRKWARTTWQHFTGISEEKLPFNSRRKSISIAEQLFGFVSKDPEKNEEENLALAGRLRFSFGILHPRHTDENFMEEVPLKILASPKPPQPNFYFKHKDGSSGRIPVGHLLDQDYMVPQGRKFYLHHNQDMDGQWKTRVFDEKTKKQKNIVTPVKRERDFYFHIDFNNLSRMELGLLCYSLRPTESFRHKIGMGKSLGLGTVEIGPLGMFLVNRKRRYEETSIFSTDRYHEVWMGEDTGEWPEYYNREKAVNGTGKECAYDFSELREQFRDSMIQEIRIALETIGDPASTGELPVHTPQFPGIDLEKETFKWFEKNNSKDFVVQPLTPVGEEGIPVLKGRFDDDPESQKNRENKRR